MSSLQQKIFRKKTLYQKFPILVWLPNYSLDFAIGDLIAGFTVALTAIPQALAFANIAGLPPQYGLYTAFFGCFTYVIFGTCKDVAFGPTATSSLLTFQTARGSWQHSVLLAFLCGFIELFMGLFGLGFILNFVSEPIRSSFVTAMALVVVTSQSKQVLGLKVGGKSFVEQWFLILKNIYHVRIGDFLLGVSCIVVLLSMRKLITFKIQSTKMQPKIANFINKFLWFLGTSSNAIVVIISGLLAAYYCSLGKKYFILVGDVPSGLPSFQVPPFSIEELRNETTGEVITPAESFFDMATSYGVNLIIIPLIGVMETMSIGKAFVKDKSLDVNQELVAMGVGNVLQSFVQGFPANGGLARSAIAHASGIRSQLGSLYVGAIIILALQYLTDYFYFIPKATLASLIISAVIFMVDFSQLPLIWRTKKSDAILWIVCLTFCLTLSLDVGLMIGIVLNLVILLYHASRPKVTLEKQRTNNGNEFLLITLDRSLVFPSADRVRSEIMKKGSTEVCTIVFDCSHVFVADFTAAKAIQRLRNDFEGRNQSICFYNLKDSVARVLDGVNHDYHVLYDIDEVEKLFNENV